MFILFIDIKEKKINKSLKQEYNRNYKIQCLNEFIFRQKNNCVTFNECNCYIKQDFKVNDITKNENINSYKNIYDLCIMYNTFS